MSDGGRILIVDDDQGTCRTLAMIFKRVGHQTETAHTGREAIERAQQASFDVALLDIRLPDMAGTDLLAPLRQIHPDLAAIMVTGHATTETAVKALNSGAQALITKPFAVDDVLAKVRACIEKQRLVLENRRLFQQAQQELAMRQQAETERERLRSQLYQADRMASLGRLAASVAHEINNPLAYMLYNLERLAEDLPRLVPALDRARRAIGERFGSEACDDLFGEAKPLCNPERLDDLLQGVVDAVKGARKVRDIARDLRTFSHVQEERRVAVSLNQVIETAINMAVNEFKYRARLIKEYGEVPTIIASDGRLSQVFLNLLVNAAHAIEDGNVERNEIRIRTWADDEHVIAEVRDTGGGIPTEEVERIFDPLFSPDSPGGLGLSSCHSIVSSYGGRIELESAPGRGTRVVVRLPRRLSHETPPPRRTRITPPPMEAPAGPHGRILVVDDEPDFGAAMNRMLRDDFNVVVVGSGAAATELLERDTAFDVILCDLLMPKISGMDLYVWLCERQPEVARRMVFMTGGAFTPRAQDFLQEVPNLQLEKPFELRYLRSLLLELLTRTRESAKGDG